MRFCETNPPFFEWIFVVSGYEYICCTRNRRRKSVGSFWKTNPPEGGFRGSEAGNVTNEPNYWSADVQREWCDRMRCAVGMTAAQRTEGIWENEQPALSKRDYKGTEL